METMEKTPTPAAPLAGMTLDLEILRFVRDTGDRTPAKVLAGLREAFPNVSQREVLDSIDRLTRYPG
ncbi:hypothetical protein [Burkholderia cenocepacia]|uniref:hypothetical protein n=1 Tax=Burkholderia cenocepacia TaxID=95486 RepID=UPI00076133DE|nr:hypothetical protein [Burkholderia cenocepacia]